ncbi:MAG: hypothetical protein PHP79_03185 [Clostridia bacterium]|nr:hypothetical protein [Clostridia bacterium]
MFWEKKPKKKEDELDLVVLKTVQNNIELEILKGILRDSGRCRIVSGKHFACISHVR